MGEKCQNATVRLASCFRAHLLDALPNNVALTSIANIRNKVVQAPLYFVEDTIMVISEENDGFALLHLPMKFRDTMISQLQASGVQIRARGSGARHRSTHLAWIILHECIDEISFP